MKDKNPYSYCNVVGDTNVGCKRKANEDWLTYFESENGLVSVVCDGMGGHVGGAVASHLAVETIEQLLKSNVTANNKRKHIGLPKFIFGHGYVGQFQLTKPIHNFDYYWHKSFALSH
jgi:protein phosphatase